MKSQLAMVVCHIFTAISHYSYGVPELCEMQDESRPGTGRDGIGLIHYSVPRILVQRNRLNILWVHRILTTSKH